MPLGLRDLPMETPDGPRQTYYRRTSSPASTTAPGRTVYLTQLSAVQDGQGYSVQPVQMDGKQYQQSFVMMCWPGASANTPSMIYEVTGYKTLSVTVGIPDGASGTSGISASFTFTKNGSTDPLGSAPPVEIGTSHTVTIPLDGATQLSINCSNSGSPDPHATEVAVGNGTLSTS